MTRSIRRIISVTLLFLAPGFVLAKPLLLPMDIPAEIQMCMDSGGCAVNSLSTSGYHGTNMFEYFDFTNNTTGKLIRYSLDSSYQVDQDVVTDFSGHVWLLAADSYDTTASIHDITLYLDQVAPAPMDIANDGDPNTIHLGLTTADLLAGSGLYRTILDSSLPRGFLEEGSLLTDGIPSPCLADGCGTEAFFSLAYLQYVDDGSSLSLMPWLDTSDTPATLYSQKSYFNTGDVFSDYYYEQVFSIQPIPLPAASWLFISGLFAVVAFVKRKVV